MLKTLEKLCCIRKHTEFGSLEKQSKVAIIAPQLSMFPNATYFSAKALTHFSLSCIGFLQMPDIHSPAKTQESQTTENNRTEENRERAKNIYPEPWHTTGNKKSEACFQGQYLK